MTPKAQKIYEAMLPGEWMSSTRIRETAFGEDAHKINYVDMLTNPLWELENLGLILKRKDPNFLFRNSFMRIP